MTSNKRFVPTSVTGFYNFVQFLACVYKSMVLFVYSFRTLKFQLTIDILPLVENGYDFNKN